MIQRQAYGRQITNSVANDGDHVAVLDHIRFIPDSAVPGNHTRSAHLVQLGNGHVNNGIQSINDALNAPAVRQVDFQLVVTKMSPALMTSDARKKTSTSPAECAVG